MFPVLLGKQSVQPPHRKATLAKGAQPPAPYGRRVDWPASPMSLCPVPYRKAGSTRGLAAGPRAAGASHLRHTLAMLACICAIFAFGTALSISGMRSMSFCSILMEYESTSRMEDHATSTPSWMITGMQLRRKGGGKDAA